MLMQNYTLNGATRILSSLGMTGAVHELNDARVPVGIATTMASAIQGNPRATRGLFDSVAPELNSPALSTAMRFGGMGAMFSMFQSIGPMLSNMLSGMGGIFNNMTNSGGIAIMGNTPGNPLARSFMGPEDGLALISKLVSVDPASGTTSRWSATPPSQAPNPTAGIASVAEIQKMGMRRDPGLMS